MSQIILNKIDKKITDGKETTLIEEFLHRLRTVILHRFNNPSKEVNLNISTFLDPRCLKIDMLTPA